MRIESIENNFETKRTFNLTLQVKSTAVQKALLNTLLQLEEIEDLLDIEEK